MITNAADKTLVENPGVLPDVSGAMLGLFQQMTFTKVDKTIENYQVVEDITEYKAMGVRQPLTTQQLQTKPEGQRSWKWEMIHALPDLVLDTDEIIVFAGVKYRVMGKWDWKEYGYVEYHIVQDYQ